MKQNTTDTAFAAVRAANPEAMSREQLAAHLTNLQVVRSWVDVAEVRATRRTSQLEAAGQSESAAAMAAREGRRSSKDARIVSDRSAVCDDMPSFESALDMGDVTAGHVDAVANAARNLNEPAKAELIDCSAALVAQAATMGVDAFERSVRNQARAITARLASGSDADELDEKRRRSSVKRWVDKLTGVHHTHLELDPLRDEQMWAVIDKQLATERQQDGNGKTPWAQMKVNAVVHAITKAAATVTDGEANDQYRPEISVLIDWQTLLNDAHSGGVCETVNGVPLPVSTVRRLCCDAHVLPLVLGGAGQILDAGRTRRGTNRAQRRALAGMHRGCAFPDCTVAFDACRIHHVEWWWKHKGPTNIDNLLPLCEQHHHLVHEGGWTLTMTSDRVATWARPDNTAHWTGTTINRSTRTPEGLLLQ
jgi:hypothetical protein